MSYLGNLVQRRFALFQTHPAQSRVHLLERHPREEFPVQVALLVIQRDVPPAKLDAHAAVPPQRMLLLAHPLLGALSHDAQVDCFRPCLVLLARLLARAGQSKDAPAHVAVRAAGAHLEQRRRADHAERAGSVAFAGTGGEQQPSGILLEQEPRLLAA